MSFFVDFDGVEMGSGGGVPAGRYNLRIVAAVEKVSKKGSPMVVVDYEVMDGPYAGRLVKFHYVVFFQDKMAPGAGMSKTFLKTIGLPYEGQITVDPSQWVGRCLVGKVVLVGGGSALKGVAPFAKEILKADVVAGDPFSKVVAPAFLEQILKETGPEFAVAVGVALRRLQEIG
jgi:hypothetical protein